jgi:hypothetical protein
MVANSQFLDGLPMFDHVLQSLFSEVCGCDVRQIHVEDKFASHSDANHD